MTFERNIEKLKQRLQDKKDIINKKQISDEEKKNLIQTEEIMTLSMLEAEKVWNIVLETYKHNKKFDSYKDDEKINMMLDKFPQFYNNYPIVSRYMICHKSYHMNAFRKFLIKCSHLLDYRNRKNNEEHMQDKWIECQAFYVQYLWEENNKEHYHSKQSYEVWKDAHKSITKEFANFKNLHDDVKKKLEENDKAYKVSLLKEAAERIIQKQQKPDIPYTENIIGKIKDIKYRETYSKVLDELKKNIQINYKTKYIVPCTEAYGINEYIGVRYNEELQQSEYRKKYRNINLQIKE